MRAYLFILIITYFSVNIASAQETFDISSLPLEIEEALVINLQDDKKITGQIHVRNREMNELKFISLPIKIESVKSASEHLVFHQKRNENTLLAYKLVQNGPFPKISNFQVKSKYFGIENDASFDWDTKENGLIVKGNGLRRHVIIKLEDKRDRQYDLPDALVVTLPDGYEGRTFKNSGSMFSPEPKIGKSPIVFISEEVLEEKIEISYRVPEPKHFSDLTAIGIRVVGGFFTIIALIFSHKKKLNGRRYFITLIVCGLLILSIYGFLFYSSLKNELGVEKLVLEGVSGMGTLVLAAITAWVLNKDDDNSKAAGKPVV